jgi:DNA-binding GntR family transcriptional regulator
MKVSFDEHTGIVDAILAGEAERARGLLRSHIAVQGDRFGDLIASLAGSEQKAL